MLGIFGYTGQIFSDMIQNTIVMASEFSNESIPTKAKFEKNIIAHALGLGSCWVQGRLRKADDGRDTEEYVRDILGYPENYKLLAILTVGVPNEEKAAYELDELPVEKIHREKF